MLYGAWTEYEKLGMEGQEYMVGAMQRFKEFSEADSFKVKFWKVCSEVENTERKRTIISISEQVHTMTGVSKGSQGACKGGTTKIQRAFLFPQGVGDKRRRVWPHKGYKRTDFQGGGRVQRVGFVEAEADKTRERTDSWELLLWKSR